MTNGDDPLDFGDLLDDEEEGDNEDRTLDDILACFFDPDCQQELLDSVGDGDTSVSTTTTTRDDRFARETVDELTSQTSRVFFAVPTPEQFLNTFENSFAGFVANAAEAGLGGGDIQQMLDPSSGFMQQMLGEYIGEIAQRAERGEDVFELAGLEGETTKVGERPGQRIETDQERKTRIEEEASSRGTTISTETPEGETRAEEEARTRTTDTTRTEGGVSETVTDRRSVFEEKEEIFQRPNITPIFKFTPNEFLLQRFAVPENLDPEEKKKRLLGQLTTEIRASAPRRRPIGGSPSSISARRA